MSDDELKKEIAAKKENEAIANGIQIQQNMAQATLDKMKSLEKEKPTSGKSWAENMNSSYATNPEVIPDLRAKLTKTVSNISKQVKSVAKTLAKKDSEPANNNIPTGPGTATYHAKQDVEKWREMENGPEKNIASTQLSPAAIGQLNDDEKEAVAFAKDKAREEQEEAKFAKEKAREEEHKAAESAKEQALEEQSNKIDNSEQGIELTDMSQKKMNTAPNTNKDATKGILTANQDRIKSTEKTSSPGSQGPATPDLGGVDLGSAGSGMSNIPGPGV